MADYPALTEMGVTRFDEISQYTLRHEGTSIDVLKIYYQRAKGSFRPQSRKYKFGRSTKTVRTDSGNGGTKEVHEISPFLQRALTELDSLAKIRHTTADNKTRLLSDLDHLERVFQDKLDDIRKKVDQLK